MILCASIAFSCFVRALSFATLSALSLENVDIDQSAPEFDYTGQSLLSESQRKNVKFYNNAISALFVTGDFTFLSVYMLLVVVTIETLQITRRHLYSNASIRRRWMVTFLALNSMLYMMQICLFLSLFLSSGTGREILKGINIVVALVNFLVPVALILAYWVLTTCVFSGFPYVSAKAQKRWQSLWFLVTAWSVTRVVWGGLAIFSFNAGWSDLFFVKNDWAFAIIVASMFILLELLPIAGVLGVDLNDLLYHSDPVTVEDAVASSKSVALMPPHGSALPSHTYAFTPHALAAAAASGVVPRVDHLAELESGGGGGGGGTGIGDGSVGGGYGGGDPTRDASMSTADDKTTPSRSVGGGTPSGRPLRPYSNTGTGHDLMVGAGASPYEPPAVRGHPDPLGEVQLRVSFDSDEEEAFDTALAATPGGPAYDVGTGGIVMRPED